MLTNWTKNLRNSSRLYDLLTATRGPDINGYMGDLLKDEITLRIRHVVFSDQNSRLGYEVGSLDVSVLDRIRSMKKRERSEWKKLSHFRSHLLDAVEASAKHPIWGGLASELSKLLEEN